jgi:2-amino-4-hydroxy-6-hydroxymethyldihydropteridine diphosphokinase
MVPVALSIGSNSGDRRRHMRRMETLLQEILEPGVVFSLLMETEPLEVAPGQPWYLNRIIGGYYEKTPMEFLEECQSIEMQLGRTGKGLRTERTADVDILLFGKEVVGTGGLVIPHPGVLNRRFCLEGLDQVMPDALIATTGKTVHEHFVAMSPSMKSQRMRFLFPQGEQHGD